MRITPLLGTIIFLLLFNSIVQAQVSVQEKQLIRKEDSLTQLLNQAKADTVKLKQLLGLINLYQDIQPQKTFQWIEKAKSIAAANKLYDKLLMFHILDMRSKSRLGQFTEAIAVADRSVYLLKEQVMPRTSTGYYLQKGQILYKMAAYDQSSIALNKAAEIAHQNKLPDVEVKAFINLTLLLDALEKYAEMRIQFLKALDIAEKNKLGEDAANIRVNLALLESRTNNYGKAIEYLNEALRFYEATNNNVSAALCYANLSYGYLQTKEYKKALQNADQSLVLRNRLNDKPGIAKLHIIVGQVFFETAQYDSSLMHLQEGIALSTTLKLPQNLRDGYKILAKLYERINQFQAAYQSIQNYTDWKDSVFQQDRQKQLIQQLNIYKAKFTDSLVQQKDAVIQSQASTINWLWTLAAFILLLLIAAGIWLFRKKAKLQSLVGITTLPDHQTALVEENHKLQQQVEQMFGEIHLLQTNLKEQTREDLINLRRLVSESNLQTEGYWNEFLLLFSRVYPNFFEQLKTNYPELTQNELRICTLMKLNLSLLEIANLLNITTESARKARYRIYKKMDLNSDRELAEKLLTL